MPSELIIPVETDTAWRPQLTHQKGMHAIMYRALEAVDPTLAMTVHEAHTKPFAQALYVGWYERNDALHWRITLLDDALYLPLLDGLAKLNDLQVQSRPIQLNLDKIDCVQQTYETLAAVPPQPRYEFRFLTPTAFKQHNKHSPIPDAYRCFQSWWARWQQYAPARFQINIAVVDVAQAHLVVSRFNLRSHMWRDNKMRLVGAVGGLSLAALRQHELDTSWWQSVATLAAFSHYCGTGHKSTQGFGQTVCEIK